MPPYVSMNSMGRVLTLLHDGEMHVDFGWRTVVVFILTVFVVVILFDMLAGRGATISRTGESAVTRNTAQTTARTCWAKLCQDASGVERKTSIGRPSKSSSAVCEICVLKKSASNQTSTQIS